VSSPTGSVYFQANVLKMDMEIERWEF